MFGESPAGIVNTMTCRGFLFSGLIAGAAGGGKHMHKDARAACNTGENRPVIWLKGQPLFTGKVDF